MFGHFRAGFPFVWDIFFNNYLFDKLPVDPVLGGGEDRAGEGVEVIGGLGLGVGL